MTKKIRRAVCAAMAALGLVSAEYVCCRYASRDEIVVMLDGSELGRYDAARDVFVKG